MPHHRAFRLHELAELLKIGEKTLNVWRHRYSQWIPQSGDEHPEFYPEESIEVFRLISKCTHAGMEPEDIERVLRSRHDPSETDRLENRQGPELTGMADLMQRFFSDIAKQQYRIADAQERRASAEERKAYALESRAEAELIKANALKDVAAFLKDLPSQDTVVSLMERVKGLDAPSPDDLGDFSMGMEVTPEKLEDLPELEEDEALDFADEAPTRDMPAPEEIMADEAPVEEQPAGEREQDVDDLSLLIDEEAAMEDDTLDIDDLSLLLEPEDIQQEVAPVRQEAKDIDDLSMLIDDEPGAVQDMVKAGDAIRDVDDLSRLIDPEDKPAAPIGAKEAAHPPEDKEAYKSKILKRIIHMKQKENLSVDETTRRFNEEGVKTLSGKGEWDQKTIQGIYKYIDSVQAG